MTLVHFYAGQRNVGNLHFAGKNQVISAKGSQKRIMLNYKLSMFLQRLIFVLFFALAMELWTKFFKFEKIKDEL